MVNNCSSLAECSNTNGSYTCECLPGYQGNGYICTGECVVIISSPWI